MSGLLRLLLICGAGLISLPALATTDTHKALLARGQYLSQAADCAACHRGPTSGTSDYQGGLAIETPLGTVIGTNITPSKRHGIGGYSEEQFRRALTEGIRADGSHLYPVMPYQAYRGMNDEDIHALYTWLREGVAPVDQPPPETHLPFPFSIRSLMKVWNTLHAGPPEPVAALDTPELRRGYYLVEVLGHCSACHSPRTLTLGEDNQRRFSGAHQEGWLAPNITADRKSGIGSWSDSEIISYLRDGHASGKGVAAGGMAEAVEYSLRHLSAADLQAITAYLRKIPAVATTGQSPSTHQPAGDTLADNPEAHRLYQSACAACHRESGAGAYNDTFPSLTHSATTASVDPSNLVMVILDGVHRQGNIGRAEMPGFRDVLDDSQVALLAGYVAQKFGNSQITVDESFVASARQGGARPWWLTALPWLCAGLLIVLIIVLVVILRRRRTTARSHSL
ncbi:cytochrome c [Salmonella enterica subsp. enterica serovar Choleraesuis]|nr:cytochrome c [Salmonella enterica subsp. enterica serovar Choleraesuis]